MSRKSTKIVVGVLLWVAAILFIAIGMIVTTAGAQEPGERVVELRLEGGTVVL